MRIPRVMAATALSLALLAAGACTDQVGLAHGDPGRDTAPQTPLVGSGTSPAAPTTQVPDSSNATLATASPVPLSSASSTPLPQSTLQPSLPAVNAAAVNAAASRGTARVFSAVTVTFSEQAAQRAAADPRLTSVAVATAVEHELAAQQLLAPGSAAPPLSVRVDDFTNSLASNAVVLGYTFRTVMLIGEVTLPGPVAPPPFDVHARARLTTRDASGTAGSLGPLFTRFAQLVVADIRGVEPPSEPIPR